MSFRTFLSLVAIFHAVSGCPAGWYGFGNSCYLFKVRTLTVRGLNWENARRECLGYGGDLVSVANKSEMDFIYSKSSQARNEHYWIGLNDRRNESVFVWSDGTPYNGSVYNNWYPNEPNDRAGEDCVELYGRKWNDDSCKKEYSYICKRPKGVPMPTFITISPPPTSAPIACPAGWVFYGSSCYKFSDVKKTWIDAKTACRSSGGYLLKIDDAIEQHFISYKQSLGYRTRWIGLNDAAVEGIYRWESDNSLVNYTHWGTEEPNDYAGVEDCIAVWGGGSAGFWNDDYCDSELYYICEKPGGLNLCPLNWRSFGDFCYQFNVHGALYKNWVDAEKACMSYNRSTELISISSASEQAFVLGELKDMRISQVWLGLNDRRVEGRYEWSDKSPLTYRNWEAKEPSTGVVAGISDCTIIDGNTQNGTWSTSPCFFRRGYICKRKIGMGQCDSPFGMEDGNIGDKQVTASSSFNISSGASQARLRMSSGNASVGAWCAARNNVGQYLQIDLGVVRQVKHIALQGRPGSSEFVRTFYLKYGNNGLDFNSYGENATVKYKVLPGNYNAKLIRNIVLPESINARFIRIYPLTWNSSICLRTEIYGCAAQASSKKCGVGWEVGLDDTCYQINSNQRKLWADARATCISRGGDLVSILSVREKAWLNNRLKALSGWAYSFWIGLNDRDMNKHFYWSDGSPFRLTAWYGGYPKDYTSQNLKACVEIDAAKGAWRDINCGEYRPFICKRKMASTNNVKFPVTGNWISATDYYWPLNAIVNGKAIGTVLATVHGNVTSSDRVQNGRDVIHFASYQAYLDAGQFPVQCIADPSRCSNGITVSFVVQFEDVAKWWNRNTFIVDTIGDETLLQGNRGFAVYVFNNRLYVTVFTAQKKWTVSQPLLTGIYAWQHVMFTWQLEKGLVLYVNGTQSTSSRYGVSIVQSGIRSPSLIVGSKSTQPLAGGFLMRSLAVWKRSFTAQEVNSIYLAEFGSCRTGWKDFGQFCYQFNVNKKSWSDARVACVNQQAELASIHSPVEQSHITLEVGPYRLQAEAWIGLHDQGVESEFEWSDGFPVQYTNWDDWNPDNWANSEDCTNVRSYNDGRWNDQNCRNSLPYICKKPKEYFPSGVGSTTGPQTRYVCAFTSSVLSCPLSTILSITSANWGRTDPTRCARVSVNNCRLDVTSIIKKRCEGLDHCSLKASNSFGSDPCGGVSKYLEINYTCKKGRVITPGCPAGWQRTPDGARCFGLLFDRKNWNDAKSACRVYGADLASLHSSTENILLTSLLVNSWDISDVGGVWIGLTDAGQKGVYKWTDGTAVDYTSWLNGQPDERVLSGSCIRATLQPGKMSWLFWQDIDCTGALPYACAMFPRNQQTPTTVPTTVSNSPCPFGWMLNGSSCYKMMTQNKTWTAARDACRAFSQHSDLVSIHSLAENSFVASLFNSSAFAAWIGLSDRGVLFGYVWSDKSPVEYTRWNPQQPDSHQGQQPCVELYSTGDWGDTGCYSVKQFICKMPRSDNKQSTTSPTNTTAVTTQAPGICPPGWILWNTMCYYFANSSQSSKLSWHAARQACQTIRGGDLVSILSVAENNFIKSKIAQHSSNALWIGLNDLGTEASYKWSDGSPVVYTNYGWKEPNDWSGQEDCLEILKWNSQWNDHHCSMLRPYICKKTNNTIIPAFTMIPPTPGPTLGRCKDGWVNYDKSCYLFVSDTLQTWTNARDVCRQGLNTSMKGDLVTVDDQYEQAFLTTMLFEKPTNFWIGFNDIHLEGTFFWTDNSPPKYTNWNANEPQKWGFSTDCVHMTSFGNAGRWKNVQCDQTKGFICETGALPLGPTTVPPSNRTCPPHYDLLGDDCYFVSYVKLSWQLAREACQRESGGDLISVHSSFEQAFIVLSLKNFKGGLWLGFVREASSAEFTWSDNSLTLFTSWAANEPDDMGSQKSCVVANNSYSNAGLWDEIDCSARNGFICRIRQGEPHVSPSVLGNCPSGWEKFDKNCFLFREGDLQSWTAARAACQRQGGNLVSITSRQEQDYIGYHYRHKSSGSIWIGLNDRAIEAGYTWSDGSPVTFINWYPGEPNDNSFLQNCVEMYTGIFKWNDHLCTAKRGYICKQPLECSAALGMVSGGIKSNQVTASSSLSPLYSPGMARLNSSSAWCAGNSQSDQFIQVDLLTETRLTKISTQGFNLNGVASYIKMFKLQTSEDGVNFMTYQKYGKDWVFVVNRDAVSVVTSAVKPTVDTRLLRLVPVSWTGSICLRMEFYGCPFACESPLGLQSGAVKDSSLTASSSSDNTHLATNARPSRSVGWCAKLSDAQPWIQISFPDVDRKITKITTWGGGKGSGYVTVYRLAFADVADVTAWSDYKEGGKIRNFRGNQDAVSPITHRLAEPIITSVLRVKPQHWSAAGACLRLELFGCEDGCDTALGLRQGVIKDSALSASSSLDQAHAASEGRLNGSTGWCASDGDKNAFFMVDLRRVMKFRKASVQGAKDGKGFIKSYTISTRDDESLPWTPFKQADKPKVFLANIDNTSVVLSIFASSILRGRFLKIIPISWSIRPCLRLELFGCKSNVQPTPIPSSLPPSETPAPPKDVVYAGSVKLSKENWTDDYKNSNSAAFKALAAKVEKSITGVYSGVDEASLAFSKVAVTGFRRGSVVVLFNLTFTRDIANELGANVTNNLVIAVRSGSLGELAVDPDSLNITKSASNESTGDQGTAAAQTGGESSGLSRGAKAGIAVMVVLLLGLCGGAGAWWFYRRRKGNHLFDHQEFDNPVYFSSEKQEVQPESDDGAMAKSSDKDVKG